jgi:hypothetical protein
MNKNEYKTKTIIESVDKSTLPDGDFDFNLCIEYDYCFCCN